MYSKYKRFILVLAFCLAALLPQGVSAADSSKAREYNFNKKKTVTVTDEKSYEETDEYTWLKYKPTADGYLTVQVSDPNGTEAGARGYLALYNGTKSRALSNAVFYKTKNNDNRYWYKFTFGLLKGQTYYLRVKSENAVSLTREFKKIKDVSGATRTKAKTLHKNKARTGLIPADSAAADWYQFNLTKNQKIRLYYNVKANGSFKLSIYAGKNGKQMIASYNLYQTSGQTRLRLVQYVKATKKEKAMNAGKYYIKIERANTMSSGYYKIKWN